MTTIARKEVRLANGRYRLSMHLPTTTTIEVEVHDAGFTSAPGEPVAFVAHLTLPDRRDVLLTLDLDRAVELGFVARED